jgi:Putative transposase/Transposase zinc-binding domain
MGVERQATDSAPTQYRPRRPSRSVLYRCVQEHLETWLAQCRYGHDDEWSVPEYVEREFRRYLDCGILAHGFARCGQCGHDFLIAFSCKGRGVCPSCNSRRMVATAAHLTDHVLPPLPVRQWVLAVPKRLRYFLHRDADLQGAALRLFLRVVEQCLRAHSPGSGPAARLGAVAFIHRFGSTLNAHLHFHCVVIDGVFDAAAAGGVVFHAASGLDANAIADVQACMRRRLLRVFVRRGLLPGDDARAMGQWQHGGGFSVDGSVRIEAADRAGRERLLRYCARPPFALERLRQLDPERLLYEGTKPDPRGNGPLLLTPLELLDRLAALVPPPRVHRHRYFGVLAPNSPLRMAVTTLALAAPTSPPALNPEPAAEPAHRRAARYTWALLLARIYEVFPLVCPNCGGAMRIIAFITDGPTVRDILVHLGEPITPPTVAPARGPPLWEMPPAGQREIDPQAQPAPSYEFDQRVAW